MGSRGRTSMASLMIPENPCEVVQRPDAPYTLGDLESDEWRAIVSCMPADHFTRANFPMLEQLCRHIIASRRVAQLIEACMQEKPFCSRAYATLLALQSAESAAIMRLSRSMRLTQQATRKAESVRLKPGLTRAPWDREQD